VCLDRLPDRVPVDSVSVENAGAAEMGVNHLISMGYRRIALVTGPLTLRNERRRLIGYKRALEKAGLPLVDSLIWNGNLKQEDVATLCRDRLQDSPMRPDAIFSTNGPTGLGVLRGLYESELQTPRDIAFITFDELVVDDLFTPAITSIIQPAFDIGFRASEILLQRIEEPSGSKRPINVRLPATLKIRDSSRPKIKKQGMA
jgi:DNA-binding LacI/PurR family transcriptional regulator